MISLPVALFVVALVLALVGYVGAAVVVALVGVLFLATAPTWPHWRGRP